MSFSERYKQLSFSPQFSHAKKYSCYSESDRVMTLNKYRALKGIRLYEHNFEDLVDTHEDSEEIQSLKSKIEDLNKRIVKFESKTCKRCLGLIHESQKLKKSLVDSEKNTMRLYNENKILNEQLSLVQKKIENYKTPTEDVKEYLRKILACVESGFEEDFQNFEIKLKSAENRIYSLSARHESLSKRSEVSKELYLTIENENKNLKKSLELKSEKIIEYEEEIFKLGKMVVRLQEKLSELEKRSKEKLNDLTYENSNLKEELNNSLLRIEDQSSEPMLSSKNISRIIVNSNDFNLGMAKKEIEEYKNQIYYLTESYNEQLEKLNMELINLRQLYSQQETNLLRSQEFLKVTEVSQKNQIYDLNNQLEEQKSLVFTQYIHTSCLLEEISKLKSELKDSNIQELSMKYSKLLLDFNINEENLKKTQKSLQQAEETVNSQKKIINSLTQGSRSQNPKSDLLNTEFPQERSDLFLKETFKKNDSLIQEMRKELLELSLELERSKLDLAKAKELYRSSEEKCKALENAVET